MQVSPQLDDLLRRAGPLDKGLTTSIIALVSDSSLFSRLATELVSRIHSNTVASRGGFLADRNVAGRPSFFRVSEGVSDEHVYPCGEFAGVFAVCVVGGGASFRS